MAYCGDAGVLFGYWRTNFWYDPLIPSSVPEVAREHVIPQREISEARVRYLGPVAGWGQNQLTNEDCAPVTQLNGVTERGRAPQLAGYGNMLLVHPVAI